ncbi:SUKH-4 family immunity protein [Streptomyces sp. NPDC093510]|uniref:SUKH-4 family immunity protein n=1 Tax=Streptomyces sp. NPDC093510 TaxID=3155199 RepID=UPI003439F645
MVTFAQAQERAEEWINGDVPGYQHREVRVREFDLGFVVWAEDRENGPVSDGGGQRLVIARDSGDATLWPGLPVGEVIRRYEEEYGLSDAVPQDAVPAPPERVDLNQTSFLLTPPEWLQEAADKLGIPDRRAETASSEPEVPAASSAPATPSAPAAPSAPAVPSAPSATSTPDAPAVPATPGGGTPWPRAAASDEDDVPERDDSLPATSAGVPAGATPWAGTDTNADGGEDHSVPLPATVFAPPLAGLDADDDTPAPGFAPDAKTALMHGGSHLPATAIAPALDAQAPGGPAGPGASAPGGPAASGAPAPGGPVGPGGPGGPAASGAAAPGTSAASVSGSPVSAGPAAPAGPAGPPANPTRPPAGSPTPPPPSAPNAPGASGASAYGYPQGPGAPDAGNIADAATHKAERPPHGTPPPPAPPGAPAPPPGSTPPPSGPGAPGTPAGGYVPTQLVSSLGPDGSQPPAAPGAPQPPAAPAAPGTPPGGVHHAATMLAGPAVGGPGAPGAPQPPAPPGAPQPPGPPGPPGAPGTPPGGVHHAATMLADPSMGGPGGLKPPAPPGAPGAPQPPGPPGQPGARPGAPGVSAGPGAPPPPPPPPGGGVHQAATMLAGPAVGGPGAPGMPPPPAPGHPGPGAPGMHGAPGMPGVPGAPGAAGAPGVPGVPGAPGGQPYGYPQQPTGQPTVGPGYQAVLRYRAADGSEQQLIRRSAPGTPHPEWQMLHELRGMNVPPQQVLELHTELESCELPGAYCARMIRETWPQARITSIAPYGRDHASRRQGMQQLLAHQGELHQVADGPARPAPVRAPLQQLPPAPPIPPEGVAQELAAAFGPGIFRFDQRAVSRQGVPDLVAHTLVVAGLPVDFGPFFWAQAQPGRPVPTLAELAQERGVQPASDAGSYLVMGSDFGRALCVQYGTANIVAVPVEAGPGGAPVPPQFVNTGLPEFARCMALLGRMWRLRFGLNQEQAGRWTVDFQNQLAALDPAALASPESWWSVLLEQMWDGLL